MANDDVEVSIGSALEPSVTQDLDQVVGRLTAALQAARAIGDEFKRASMEARKFSAEAADVGDQLRRAQAEGRDAAAKLRTATNAREKKELEARVKDAQEEVAQLREQNENLRARRFAAEGRRTDIIDDNKTVATARSAAMNQIGRKESLVTPGRTVADDQLADATIKALETGYRATAVMGGRRVADSAGKAAEYLVKTAEDALAARFNKVGIDTSNLVRNFSGTGLARTQVYSQLADYSKVQSITDKFGNEMGGTVARTFGPERQAEFQRLQAMETAQRQLAADRREADAENARRDREARRQSDPAYAMQQVRKDAQSQRTYGMSRDDLEAKIAPLSLTERKVVLKALEDQTLATAKAEKALQSTIVAGERERQKLANPATALRTDAANASNLRKYGLGTDDLNEQLKALPVGKERAALLADLRQKTDDLRKAQAAQRAEEKAAEKPGPKTNEQIAERAAGIRDAILNRNGGADMLGFQARLIANYTLLNGAVSAISGAGQQLVEFDDKLKQFQAITGTSNSEMGGFRDTLLSVASASKYSVTELTEAAITLGQTGLAAKDVQKALTPVVNLAAASGSSLKDAVEAITSVLGAYQMEAGRAAEISNVFVEALNQTKLTMTQLQLGIQYSANIARDAGVSFSELTAVIGGIAQAGVKSGSTIGTGTRQLIQELSAPTDKLREVFKQLNVSIGETDIRTNGLIGVLDNLRAKGFTSADALRALDLRAASAFSAIVGQADKIKRLQESLLLSNSAAESAAIAQESLLAVTQRFGNTLFAVADKSFAPFIEGMKTAISVTTGLFSAMGQLGPLLPIVGTGLATVAAALLALKLASVGAGLLGFTSLAAVMGPLAIGIPIILGASAAFAALAYGISQVGTASADAAAKLDRIKGLANELQSQQSAVETAVGNIDSEIGKLLDRREKLNSDPLLRRNAVIEAQKAFGDLGLSIDANTTNVDKLVEALRKLRGELQEKNADLLSKRYSVAAQELDARIAKANVDKGNAGKQIATALGGGIAEAVSPAQAQKFAESKGLGGLSSVFDIIRDPSKIDGTNAKGSTAAQQQAINSLRDQLENERGPLGREAAATGRNSARLDEIMDSLKRLDAVEALFKKTIDEQAAIQGNRVRVAATGIERNAETIRSNPEFQAIKKNIEDLAAEQKRRAQEIAADTSIGGVEKKSQLTGAIRNTQGAAGGIQDQLNAFVQKLTDANVPEDEIKAATAQIINDLAGVRKSVTKELDEIAKAIRPETLGALQADRRSVEAQIENLMKSSGRARTDAEQEEIKKQIEALAERRRVIAQQIFETEVTNPDTIDQNPDLKAKRAEIDDEERTKLKTLMDRMADDRRKLADRLLGTQERSLDGEKAALESQQSQILKKLKNPDTKLGPATDALKETFDKLAERIKAVADQIDAIKFQRELIKNTDLTIAPPGTVPNGGPVTGSQAETAAQITKAAFDAGREDRLQTLLRFASAESSLGANQGSPTGNGAKGTFQFIPSTAKQYGIEGREFDTEASTKAAIKFLDDLDAQMKGILGRAATDQERYVAYNQGTGAAAALYANPDRKAIDIYREMGLSNPEGRITQNTDTLDMTAAQFIESLKKYADKSFAKGDSAFEASAGSASTLRKNRIDEETKKAEAEQIVREREIRVQRAKDQSEADRLAKQQGFDQRGVKNATTPEEGTTNAMKVLDDLAAIRDREIEKLKASKDYRGMEPEEQKLEVQKKTDQFAAQAAQIAETNAKAIGDVALKKYQEAADEANKSYNFKRAEENQGKFSGDEINAAKELADKANDRLNLEGKLAEKKAEILAIDQQLAALVDKGLYSEQSRNELLDKRNALEKERIRLQGQQDLKVATDASAPDYEKAFNKGKTDFLQSRGIMDGQGKMISEAVQWGKAWNGVLNSVSGSFDNLFTNLASGTMKAGDAFKKFATDILSDLTKMASKAVTNELFKMLLGGGDSKDSGGGLFSGLASGIGSIFGTKSQGGLIRAAQGYDGSPNRDSVPTLLMPGEGVLRKSAMDAIGRDGFSKLNALGSTAINEGAPQAPAPTDDKPAEQGVVNVWVVSQDQVPPPGPNDIVAHVSDNIQRGGSIKQLIKQVSVGAI